MMMNAIPVCSGRLYRMVSIALSPPADAPIMTTGKFGVFIRLRNGQQVNRVVSLNRE